VRLTVPELQVIYQAPHRLNCQHSSATTVGLIEHSASATDVISLK